METNYELADSIEDAMEAAPTTDWTPSQMARKVKAELQETREVLSWMEAHQYIASYGAGSRVHFTLRRR